VSEGERPQASGIGSVLRAGVRHALLLAHGSAPGLDDRRAFAATLTRALRPHFFVFPAGAALVGAAGAGQIAVSWRVGLAAAAAGLGWGVGQLVNDLLDVEADRVDAPDRPAVRGLLPLGPTAAVALALALLVTLVTLTLHPAAPLLAVMAALLLAVYPAAKRLPGAGNLAHGALVSTAAAIGLAAAAPDQSLLELAAVAWPSAAYTGLVAALYLQANCEKDRAGDARAGYRTLAHVLGVRLSAALRAGSVLVIVWLAVEWQLAASLPARVALGAGALLTLISAVPSLLRGTDRAALGGYRFAVHATTALMLAPVTRLSPALAVALVVLSLLLFERAFQKSPNP
jgi:geranylgeranylglycerol-phosphate geranylgeranyltransferase